MQGGGGSHHINYCLCLGLEKAPASGWKGLGMDHRSSMSHFSATDPLGAEKGVYAFCDLLGEHLLNTSASHL